MRFLLFSSRIYYVKYKILFYDFFTKIQKILIKNLKINLIWNLEKNNFLSDINIYYKLLLKHVIQRRQGWISLKPRTKKGTRIRR